MRKALLLAVLILAFSMPASAQNLFQSLRYDRVVIYDFNREDDKHGIVKDGKLSASIQKQAQLTASEIKSLNTKLWQKQSYGGGTASCFIPHLGIVYYWQDKIVAHISICLDCNRLVSSIEIPAQKQGKQVSGCDVFYIRDGMSKSFRIFLNNLVRKNKFSHALLPGSSSEFGK